MKFAICNELFKDWKIEDAFSYVSKVGYEGIEIAPFTLANSVEDVSMGQRQYLRRFAREHNLEIIGLHWLLVSPEGLYINTVDKAIRKRTQDYFLSLINFCSDLGGNIMVIGSPKQRNVLEGMSDEEAWEISKEFFKACLPLAQEKNVLLCIEPLSSLETNFITTAQQGLQLVKELNHPNFKLHLDVKAMSSEDKSLPEIIKSAQGNLAHFHANDANKKGPGFGDTDFLPVAAALKEIGYDGYVSVEVFDYSPDPQTIAEKSIEYLKKVFS